MWPRFLLIFSAALIIGATTTGCVPDTDGVSGPGQECLDDDDCADELVCSQRICRSAQASNGTSDNSDNGASNDQNDDNDLNNRASNDQNDDNDVQLDQNDDNAQNDSVDDCCFGGCSDDEICHDCSCESYDPDQCTFQDQPCSTEGQITDNFVCSPATGEDQLRCFGLCDPGADDPDATCPGSTDSICRFEDRTQANGFCTTSCAIGDQCADDAMTCIYNATSNDEGLCQPQTGDGQLGEACDSGDFFGCEGEGICVAGFCQQSCRPFDQNQTDCQQGYCLPLNSDIGICAESSAIGDGECTAGFTTCGEDATGCFPEDSTDPQPSDLVCREMCRLQQGDQDCPAQYTCQRHDSDNESVGYCLPG